MIVSPQLDFRKALIVLLLWAVQPAMAARYPWKAGVAKIAITPTRSLWMAGYAARTKPSEGVLQDLYAKALALEDARGMRAVLVTTDLLGFPAALEHRVAERVEKQYKLPRERVIFNSSHTHCGPVLDRVLEIAYEMTPQQWSDTESYTRELENKLVQVAGEALKDLAPASVSFGHGEAAFAMNRRTKKGAEYAIGVNPEGPVDHDVPVLSVEGKGGKLRAIIFGYACHNTTLGGDFYQFNGDYAGFAQAWLESHHSGAIALFVAGCGADANPNHRGTVDLARQHGEELAAAVEKVLGSRLKSVGGPLKCVYQEFPVAFGPPPSREEFEKRLHDPDKYVRRHAAAMLNTLDREGRLPGAYPYPLQVWQFGRDLTFIAMAGEVVSEYALRLKRELGQEKIWVAGYSNDVFAYIPSLQVLREGGYEASGAMIYYGQPGPFSPEIEETIIRKVHELVKRAGK